MPISTDIEGENSVNCSWVGVKMKPCFLTLEVGRRFPHSPSWNGKAARRQEIPSRMPLALEEIKPSTLKSFQPGE